MLLVCVLLCAGIWTGLTLAHGTFWRSGPVLPRARPAMPVTLAVVIPARNEAEHVIATIRSLLQQTFAGDLHIVLVDDNSTDATGSLGRALAAEDSRLRVLSGQPLPDGWSGKMWAVSQGLAQPEVLAAEYVLLTDADIVHGPGHLEALIATAQAGGFGMVSEMVRLRCESFAERATLPAFVFFFQMLYPFRRVNNPRSRTAAAAGGTMLLSQDALRAVGGVSQIRSALIDDVALARVVKAAGLPLWLGHGEQVVSERRYLTFGEVWGMIARTAYVQLRYSPLLLAGTCVGMGLVYLLPVLATCFGTGIARWVGVACWATMALTFGPTLRRYRQSSLWGVALPAIALFYLGATVHSALRFYRGRGGQWKDRTYAAES